MAIVETISELTTIAVNHNLEKTVPSKFGNGHATVAELDASLTTARLTTSPKPVPAHGTPERRSHLTCFTDHMLTCQYTTTTGWQTPQIVPHGPLSIMPSASCLQYATECFEGMKLYRGYDGALRLFRPELNAKRMLLSSTRISLPGFDPEQFMKLVVQLCATDGPKWLPADRPGDFLYIRPTMIGNDPRLGVAAPQEALLFVILTCFPALNEFKDAQTGASRGMRLLASKEDEYRAWPGGFGYAKLGANYAPTLAAQHEAKKMGFDTVLWLFGNDFQVTESGTSNMFVLWRTSEGRCQLVTPPLDSKIILDGITRRSVIELTRERLSNGWAEGGFEPVEVIERVLTMPEIEQALNEGRMVEAFAVGTAYFVAPVECISWQGRQLEIPIQTINGIRIGKYAALLKGWLEGIMYGKEKHQWGYVVPETN